MNKVIKSNSLSNITKIDLALAITGLYFSLSGLLIQLRYHMHDKNKLSLLLGMDYSSWNILHIISSLLGLVLVCIHVYQHRKWYLNIIRNRRLPKQKPTLIISAVFLLMAFTGLASLALRILDPVKFAESRFMFIEIHDKLGILLSIFLTGHILRRLNLLGKNILKTFSSKKVSGLYSNPDRI